MKLPFTIYDSRFAILKKSGGAVSPLTADGAHAVARPTALNRKSSIVNHKSRSGIALVITLILLSVTLVMALAFLAISRRESSSVATSSETAAARSAADSALANAEAQAMATILSTTNPYNFGLLVSTNYINPLGGNASSDPTNVNYDNAGGNWNQNVANLYYSPRAQVFVTTNSSAPLDFRFYLDMNRNGKFDTNGVVGNFDAGNNFLGTISEVGNPEWIGVLEHPDAPHGPDNKFISRYAYIAQPVGNSLDLNAIHNQAFTKSLSSPDGFMRNQGVGSWEINLAAFLADLNTNVWLPTVPPDNFYYAYYQPNSANVGIAFEDALSLLSYRYSTNGVSSAGNYN